MPAGSPDDKTTQAYPLAELQAPMYTGPPQQGYQQPPPQDYAPQQQGYAPQPMPQTQMSAQQVGDQFRGQLFAQCAQGMHQPSKKYGVFGIIVAVVCFPIGLIALLIDVENKCDRCGLKLS
ncbi:hypothetical protein B0H14DRAFT_3592342 [Mycena olivaceomarginata]|nr:hypothetical protein B0H14DRAFT_3592342 [Mycena olivaceomarginata]